MICPGWIGIFEIERPEINRIVGLVVNRMECESDKTLLKNVLAPNVEFDRSVAES
jgi:hypothetical protein